MSCPHPIELSRALVAGIDERLQAHLDTCARCTAELESHANVSDDTRVLPIVEPTADHARLVRAALTTAARAPARAAAPWKLWLAGFGAATAIAAAAILFVVLRTPARPAQVALAYRGSIHPHDGAQFIRVGGAPDEIVRLTEGTITVEVSPLAPGERFRVITADGEVEVRGTAFDVSAEADHLTAVRVLHGKVEVRASGAAPKLLAAGERWEMKLATADPAPPVPEPPVPAPTHDAVVAAAADDVVDDAADAVDDGADAIAQRPRDAKIAAKVDAKRDARDAKRDAKVAATVDAKHDAARDANVDAKPTAKADHPPAASNHAITTDPSRTSPSAPGAPKRPIEILFEQGWAALAAGNPRDAATAFERAATSAPNDPLAEDAWFWRASALARAKSSSATAALEQFLARYPRSNRAGEASAVLGWIVIASDLDRAEKLFEAAARDRVPAVRASAEKGLAAVAKHRGR